MLWHISRGAILGPCGVKMQIWQGLKMRRSRASLKFRHWDSPVRWRWSYILQRPLLQLSSSSWRRRWSLEFDRIYPTSTHISILMHSLALVIYSLFRLNLRRGYTAWLNKRTLFPQLSHPTTPLISNPKKNHSPQGLFSTNHWEECTLPQWLVWTFHWGN